MKNPIPVEELMKILNDQEPQIWHLISEDRKTTVCGQPIQEGWVFDSYRKFSDKPCSCCIKEKLSPS